MPRYFFDIHDGIEFSDPNGTELSDHSAARIRAVSLATDHAKMPAMLNQDGGVVIVNVRDNAGGRPIEVRLAFTVADG